MAQNASNVSILKPRNADGVAFHFPVGTAINPDASVALPTGGKSAGYISSDGFTLADGAEAGEGVVAFGGDTVTDATSTINKTVAFTLLEMENPEALELLHNSAEIVVDPETGEVSIIDRGLTPESKVLVLEFARKGNKVTRFVFPLAEYSTKGDRVISNDAPDSQQITLAIRRGDVGEYDNVFRTESTVDTSTV